MRVYISGAITGKFKYREDFSRGEARVNKTELSLLKENHLKYDGCFISK